MVIFLLACSAAVEAPPEDTAPPTESFLESDIFYDACEAEFERQIPPFDVHFSVLTDSPQAPVAGEESVTSCTPEDTRWPCSHISALTKTFIDAEGNPVCDPEHPEQCIRFRYKDHRYFDALVNAPGCNDAIAAARGIRTPILDSGGVITALREATAQCTDSEIIDPYAINVLLFDNPISGLVTSFATAYTSRWSAACAPYVYIEVSRLPSEAGEDFRYAVNEHEFGHIFGLDHVCRGVDEAPYPDTNIMQGTGSSCCCECGPDRSEAVDSLWSTQICYDCSGVSPTDRCSERPVGQCSEPECTTQVSQGSRNEGFSSSVLGSARSETDQLTTILATARGQHECWCRQALASGHRRWTVEGEATCSPGQGVFRLLKLDPNRPDHLTPVRLSGDALSPLADIEIQGSAGEEVSLSWSCSQPPTEIFTSHRPTTAYRLPLSALGSDLADNLILRLDEDRQQLWVALEGQPGEFRVLQLLGKKQHWQWPGPGRAIRGTVQRSEGALRIKLASGEALSAVEISRKLSE